MKALAGLGETQALRHSEKGAQLFDGHGGLDKRATVIVLFYQSIHFKNQLNKYIRPLNTHASGPAGAFTNNKRGVAHGWFR